MNEIERQYDAKLLTELMALAKIAPEQKSEFERIIKHWAGLNQACYEDHKRHPDFKQIEADLKKIRDFSRELGAKLDQYHVEYELWTVADDGDSGGNPIHGFDRVQAARNEIALLQRWASEAAAVAAKKKRRKQRTSRRTQARREAVTELGHIWKSLTGKRPTRSVENPASNPNPQPYGAFQNFVRLALLPIFGPRDILGIDRDIRQTCRFMDNNPDAEVPSYVHMKPVS